MPTPDFVDSRSQVASLADYLDARAQGAKAHPSALDPTFIATDRRMRDLDRFGQPPVGAKARVWDDVMRRAESLGETNKSTTGTDLLGTNLASVRNLVAWSRRPSRSQPSRWIIALESAAVILLLLTTIVLVKRVGVDTDHGPKRSNFAAASPTTRVLPTRLHIETIGVDAEVTAVEGIDPAAWIPLDDPWQVAWDSTSASPGEPGNLVLAGHLDFWNVGPAVFWDVKSLVPGDRIVVVGDEGQVYRYHVVWVRNYEVDGLLAGPERIEVIGPMDEAALTLISEGGEFSFEEGEYLGRIVVRAVLVARVTGEATPEAVATP